MLQICYDGRKKLWRSREAFEFKNWLKFSNERFVHESINILNETIFTAPWEIFLSWRRKYFSMHNPHKLLLKRLSLSYPIGIQRRNFCRLQAPACIITRYLWAQYIDKGEWLFNLRVCLSLPSTWRLCNGECSEKLETNNFSLYTLLFIHTFSSFVYCLLFLSFLGCPRKSLRDLARANETLPIKFRESTFVERFMRKKR